MFIVIDGVDGSGKGVQIEMLREWLRAQGREVVFARDPGGTPLGDAVRNILLDRKDLDIDPIAERALFMASRAQLVRDVIKPALDSGKIALADRYLVSTVVYQGYANDCDDDEINEIWSIGAKMASGVLPDVALILDCPTDVAFKRINRPKDRIESKSEEFHRKVSRGYRRAVEAWSEHAPGEAFLLDAQESPENVFRKIVEILKPRLKEAGANDESPSTAPSQMAQT